MKALYILIVISMITVASEPPKPETPRIGESNTIDPIYAEELEDYALACAYAKATGGNPGPAPEEKQVWRRSKPKTPKVIRK